jgi:hypothetical protein
MSYTIMNFHNTKGKVEWQAEFQNAWNGAWAIWDYFWNKYDLKGKDATYNNMIYPEDFKKVWDLYKDDRLSRAEKILLGSTFDWVVIRRSEFEELAKVYEDFNIGHLPEQAKLLRENFKDEKVEAITYCQTSVAENKWENYNLHRKKGREHFFLFDDLTSHNDSKTT